jgi:hypothetical protein
MSALVITAGTPNMPSGSSTSSSDADMNKSDGSLDSFFDKEIEEMNEVADEVLDDLEHETY